MAQLSGGRQEEEGQLILSSQVFKEPGEVHENWKHWSKLEWEFEFDIRCQNVIKATYISNGFWGEMNLLFCDWETNMIGTGLKNYWNREITIP